MKRWLIAVAGLLLVSCGSTPTPQVIRETAEPTRTVERVTAVLVTATPSPTRPSLERAWTSVARAAQQTDAAVSFEEQVRQQRYALDVEAKHIPYDSLARNTEQYVQQLLYYEGSVVQVMETIGFKAVLRVNVTRSAYGSWRDTVWVNYEGYRILEGDHIEMWARVEGRRAYRSVFGQQIVIPELTAVLVCPYGYARDR